MGSFLPLEETLEERGVLFRAALPAAHTPGFGDTLRRIGGPCSHNLERNLVGALLDADRQLVVSPMVELPDHAHYAQNDPPNHKNLAPRGPRT